VHGAGDRVLDGRELDQEAVAGELDDAAGMGRHRGIDNVVPRRRPRGDGAVRVLFHETGIARHVGGQDGGESPLNLLTGHDSSRFLVCTPRVPF